MIKICFVCLGNICRSPMAEFMFKDLVKKNNLEDKIYITSKATSYEEEGNDMYHLAKKKLTEKNIFFEKRKATRVEKEDYEKYDYFICMEERNINNLLRIFGEDKDNKVFKLLALVNNKDISDPWYTNDFETTYNDLEVGLNKLLEELKKHLS